MTSKQRLEQYRREAATGKWVRPLTWRDTRHHHPSPWGAPRPSNARGARGQIYSDSLNQYGNDLGTAHSLFPRLIEGDGWYADNWQNALIVGHVVKLRSPRGTLYIPATRNTDCDGTTHYLADAERVPRGASEDEHDNACREAARSADHYAEREAEEAREDDAKWQAEQQIEMARARIHEINQQALALLAETKPARTKKPAYGPAVCEALRTRVRALLADRARQFSIIGEREANYWSACPNY